MHLLHSAFAAVKRQRRALSRVRTVFYWGLPPVLIYLIARKVDLAAVREVLSQARLSFVGLGMLLMILVVSTAGLRWWWLVRRLNVGSLPVTASLIGYSRSLAIGVTAPGSLGSDAYRTLMAGRVLGRYGRAAFTVVVEKFSAVLAYGSLVVLLFPLLPPHSLPAAVGRVIDGLSLLLLALVLGLVSMASLGRQAWVRSLACRFQRRVGALARRLANGGVGAPDETRESDPRASLPVSALWSMGTLAPALLLSIFVQVFTAVQTQCYFAAFGFEISFLANLFVNQILFFLFLLPISFGGIGVREGAYILLYGAFGVPEETALVVALCSFLGVLFSYALGACLFLLKDPGLTLPPNGAPLAGSDELRSVATSTPRAPQ